MDKRERLIRYWAKENIVQRKKGYFDYVTRRMFDQYLSNLKSRTVLDVGCGMGMSMEYFRQHGAIVKGVDISPSSVEFAKQKQLDVVQADARDLPFENNRFDIVYSIGVIEHFRETELALKEQVRVCKPGGTVIAAVPNLATPYCVGTILFEVLSGRIKYGLLATYGKPFSKNKFKKMFTETGCKNISVQPYYGSAFLRFLFNKVYRRATDVIEESFLSKIFGLVLWGIGYKR